MALCYKLEGQEGFCGPIPIDREAQGIQDVSVRTARASGLMKTSLAFDVSTTRTGEPAVVLHSGVQVSSSSCCSFSRILSFGTRLTLH